MIREGKYKEVKINITTFKSRKPDTKPENNIVNMNDNSYKKHNHKETSNRFICSICLNANTRDCNQEFGRRQSMSCPKCRQSCDFDKLSPRIKTRTVQTSNNDVNQDLNLLKEVLTVFKNSKQVVKKSESDTLKKDVSVETDMKISLRHKLSKSRTFQFSIAEDSAANKVNNCKVIHYSEPDNVRRSHFGLDLSKRKSSSIPQMKIEELRHSLKEKTTSKDAIEEVNRMFATVRRNEDENRHNRPFVRTGPRVLPVVRTNIDNKKKESSESDTEKLTENTPCKCCHANNWQMSGGDSAYKQECCYQKVACKGDCEKCIYMVCCHHEKLDKMESSAYVCERCNKT
ncbi:unnamed protein product [Chilo suppressalis]|uniref:Zinc finger PHD-type domain-containing protein n=1 Tax=Chilo suppressalis TaxID=168631 RepID=A0ABN8B9D0_CHISP|nr:unnamed protein product [Chilo suppressalis]